ncbi:MAG: protein phosphatase 2C domain-containing protein [Acidimicrobiales bacterium]
MLRPCGSADTAAYRGDEGDHDRWCLRATSVAGIRHRLAGAEVEDAYAWRRAATAIVVAVGDGVGSVAGSAAASRRAVHAACDAAAVLLDREDPGAELVCEEAVTAANVALSSDTGATTLVVVVAGPEGECTVARVGDSTAMVLAAGEWQPLFPRPAADGVTTTATAALPDDSPSVELATCALLPGQALVAMTDGVAEPLHDGPTTVAPALAAGLVEPPSALGLAALIDFSRQGCHDDRTVVGLWRRC